MNAVEIEEAVSALATQPFDAAEFPYQFLAAFGNKDTTLKRLRKGESNRSDLAGRFNAVLQANNIHIAVAPKGEVAATLAALRTSPATAKGKAKFILATDGEWFEAEDLISDTPSIACAYADFPNHFGFFLPLAGISTVRQIAENAFDIRATGRLNRLYLELRRLNPDWDTNERRPDMNHFMARLIFCFFAEKTDIFIGNGLFTDTVAQMGERDGANTHAVIGEIFRAMNVKGPEREAAGLPRWADAFPYVNGGLFSGSLDVPRFNRTARSYLLNIGTLDWRQINPDIFGSMIQAVADDEERGALGMHYTSVPNILKVLNPLFLDDLRAKLTEAGDNPRLLLNLRKRMARIRVFDPACGSGNFLVIAYKEMRAIEAEINAKRGEAGRRSDLPLTNFRGIELRDFPAEIARLALIIAEYQCDVLHRGEQVAMQDFLPLDAENWVTCGNALRLDWLTICPPTGTGVKHRAEDLFHTPLDQAQIDFENEGGETYICGNPPYTGYNKQTRTQKEELAHVFSPVLRSWGNLDYVAAWFLKAITYLRRTPGRMALVSTNSICQGGQVSVLWPLLERLGAAIFFAHTSFKWSNLATHNAGITVVIVGLALERISSAILYEADTQGIASARTVQKINGYLIAGPSVYVSKRTDAVAEVSPMSFGNHPYYGSHLFMSADEARRMVQNDPGAAEFLRPIYGSTEIIKGNPRYCLWIPDERLDAARSIDGVWIRVERVRAARKEKRADAQAVALAETPHRFRDVFSAERDFIAVPQTSSENRAYLPCTIMDNRALVTFKCFALYDAPTWNMALVASRLHVAWIRAVCGRMRTDFSYSNTLGWNTFPVPTLTEKNKADLTRCAEDILLAREAHFPATIADLYDPETMPPNLRAAHERNDEVLERIYIGRRFRNDTERLEKLFDMYAKMVAAPGAAKKRKAEARA